MEYLMAHLTESTVRELIEKGEVKRFQLLDKDQPLGLPNLIVMPESAELFKSAGLLKGVSQGGGQHVEEIAFRDKFPGIDPETIPMQKEDLAEGRYREAAVHNGNVVEAILKRDKDATERLGATRG